MNGPVFKDGKVQCEICKKWFLRLSNHIQSHGMKADDYRGMFGYSIGTNLDLGRPRGTNTSKVYEKRKIDKKFRAYRGEEGVEDLELID